MNIRISRGCSRAVRLPRGFRIRDGNVDGEEIREYCNGRKLGLVQRLELFRKICDAVANAHQKLVVHRDLKPSNILVTKDGEPKLLDFGIAKLTSPDWNADTNEATITQFRIMTPEYASPEQLAGEATATSTDIYSLGVVLYELLTGERPHITRGKTPKEIADSVLSSEPPKPSTVRLERSSQAKDETGFKKSDPTGPSPGKTRETPEIVESRYLQGDLDNIILKAMRRDPDADTSPFRVFRGHSALSRRTSVNATADSRFYRFNKYFKRHRVGVIGTAAAAVLLFRQPQYGLHTRLPSRKSCCGAAFCRHGALAKSVLRTLRARCASRFDKSKRTTSAKAIEYLDRLAAKAKRSYLLTDWRRISANRRYSGGMGDRTSVKRRSEDQLRKARALREAVVASGGSDPKFRFKLAMAYTKAGIGFQRSQR